MKFLSDLTAITLCIFTLGIQADNGIGGPPPDGMGPPGGMGHPPRLPMCFASTNTTEVKACLNEEAGATAVAACVDSSALSTIVNCLDDLGFNFSAVPPTPPTRPPSSADDNDGPSMNFTGGVNPNFTDTDGFHQQALIMMNCTHDIMDCLLPYTFNNSRV